MGEEKLMSIATIKAHADTIAAEAAAIKAEADALPPPGEPPPQTLPPAQNCLGGTVPSLPSFTTYDYWSTRKSYHERGMGDVLPGSIAWLGTSISEAMNVARVHPACINYGIGGDTIAGVLNRLGGLQPSLSQAGAVVLEIGVNDCGYVVWGTMIDNLDKVLDWLTGPLVVLNLIPSGIIWPGGGVPYLSQASMAAFNDHLTTKLAGRPHCQIVNVCDALRNPGGWMKPEYSPDLCHPNAAGYAVMRPLIAAGLASVLA